MNAILKNKYDLGQTVWYLHQETRHEDKIKEVVLNTPVYKIIKDSIATIQKRAQNSDSKEVLFYTLKVSGATTRVKMLFGSQQEAEAEKARREGLYKDVIEHIRTMVEPPVQEETEVQQEKSHK